MRTLARWLLSLSLLLGARGLQADGDFPDLILRLESHNNYYCIADDFMHSRLAASGHFIRALEGTCYGQKVEHGHGFDDPLNYGLAQISKAHHDMTLNVLTRVPVWGPFHAFFSEVRCNPVLRKEWFSLRKDGQLAGKGEETREAVLASLDRSLDLENGDYQQEEAKLAGLESDSKDKVLREVFWDFAGGFLFSYNTRILFEYDSTARFKEISVTELLGLPTDPEAAAMRERLQLTERNEFMAANLAKLYQTAKAKGVPLVATVGSLHGEGLKRLLAKLLGPQVRIRTLDSRAAFKALYDSRSPEDTVGVLLDQYSACQPERCGFKTVLAEAEMAARLSLVDRVQVMKQMTEHPRTLTLEQTATCPPLISGSGLTEAQLRRLAEAVRVESQEIHGIPAVLPCVIL